MTILVILWAGKTEHLENSDMSCDKPSWPLCFFFRQQCLEAKFLSPLMRGRKVQRSGESQMEMQNMKRMRDRKMEGSKKGKKRDW